MIALDSRRQRVKKHVIALESVLVRHMVVINQIWEFVWDRICRKGDDFSDELHDGMDEDQAKLRLYGEPRLILRKEVWDSLLHALGNGETRKTLAQKAMTNAVKDYMTFRKISSDSIHSVRQAWTQSEYSRGSICTQERVHFRKVHIRRFCLSIFGRPKWARSYW